MEWFVYQCSYPPWSCCWNPVRVCPGRVSAKFWMAEAIEETFSSMSPHLITSHRALCTGRKESNKCVESRVGWSREGGIGWELIW